MNSSRESQTWYEFSTKTHKGAFLKSPPSTFQDQPSSIYDKWKIRFDNIFQFKQNSHTKLISQSQIQISDPQLQITLTKNISCMSDCVLLNSTHYFSLDLNTVFGVLEPQDLDQESDSGVWERRHLAPSYNTVVINLPVID